MPVKSREFLVFPLRVLRALRYCFFYLLVTTCTQAQTFRAWSSGANDANGTNISTGSLGNAAAGELCACCVSAFTTADAVSSVTATGNTTGWARLSGSRVTSAGTGFIEIWYKENLAAATAMTVTANFSSAQSYRRIMCGRYSGMASLSAADVAATGSGNSNAPDTANLTTTQANELLMACAVMATTTTYSSWNLATLTGTERGEAGSDSGYADANATATFTDDANVTASASGDWLITFGTFKASGGAPLPAKRRVTIISRPLQGLEPRHLPLARGPGQARLAPI